MTDAERSSKQKRKLLKFCQNLQMLYMRAIDLGFSVNTIQLPTYFGATVYYAFNSFIPPFLREKEPIEEVILKALLARQDVCE